jgi:hypothetical protein
MTMSFSRKTLATFLLPLGALLLLELIPLLGTADMRGTSTGTNVVQTLSGQSSLGAIDDEAVMVMDDAGATRSIPLCQALPEDTWVFLILLYVLLIVFNLREQYRLYKSVRYWRFEVALSTFFLFEWFVFDTCRQQVWFPLTLLKSGLILLLIFEIKSLYQNSLHLKAVDCQDTD